MTDAGRESQRAWMALGLIMVVGAVLRLLFVTAEGFWFDEFCIWRQAHMTLPELYDDLVASDVHPPLYQLVILGWSALFGTDELALRMPSVLFGVAVIPVAYAIGRHLYDHRTGLLTALLTALARDPIYYSQEARSYSMLLLLAAATFYTWLRVRERASPRRLAVYAGVGVLLAYTHAFGLLFLVFLTVAWAVLWRREQAGGWTLKRWWWTHVVMGLLFAPWLPALLAQTTRIQGNFWIDTPKPWFFAEYLYDYFGNTPLVVLTVALMVVAFLGARGEAGEGEGRLSAAGVRLLLLGWLVFMFWVPYVISIVSQPMMHSKSALMVVVPIAALASRGLLEVWARSRRAGGVLLALWVGLALYAVIATVYVRQNREGWREMSAHVAQRYEPGRDRVVLYHPDYDYFYCYRYYLEPEIEAEALLCAGDACRAAVAPIEARADEDGVERLWLLKIRASDVFPEGLDARWRVVEERDFVGGVLQLLERRTPPGGGPGSVGG